MLVVCQLYAVIHLSRQTAVSLASIGVSPAYSQIGL